MNLYIAYTNKSEYFISNLFKCWHLVDLTVILARRQANLYCTDGFMLV